MNAQRRDVLVIGGGISGLTVAWTLHKAGVDVCLMDAAQHVGGCSQTSRKNGFLLERGPFNVIVRDPSFERMLEDVADTVSVVPANDAAKLRYIYRHGKLHVVPTNPIALMRTKLLSVRAKARLLRGLLWSHRSQSEDETIETVVSRRLGPEVADTIVSAAVNGILAGDISKLSLGACFPLAAKIDAAMRSPIGYGLRKALGGSKDKRAKHKRKWPGLVSIEGGLGVLMDALASPMGDSCKTNCKVNSILPNNTGYEVAYKSPSGQDSELSTLSCRRIVMALPVAQTVQVLSHAFPQAASAIEPVLSSPLTIVNLGYRNTSVGHPLRGFGFLVPRNEKEMPIMGALFADSVFPHHAPRGHRLLRVFLGGAQNPDINNHTDEQLRDIAIAGLRNLLHITGDPVLVDIIRYKAAIPQYHAGHRDRIAQFIAAIEQFPGMYAVGNYLEGASLNDCVRVAHKCAENIIEDAEPKSAAMKEMPSTKNIATSCACMNKDMLSVS